MTRVNVYRYHDPVGDWDTDGESSAPGPEPVLAGWFSYEKAQRWCDEDSSGNGSDGTGRGRAVLLTNTGRWVLEHWTRWSGEAPRHEYISAEDAREWLLGNGADEAVAEHFGEIEEDRTPGRPVIGGAVHVRLGDLVARVDSFAADFDTGHKMSRADAVRELVKAGLIYYKR